MSWRPATHLEMATHFPLDVTTVHFLRVLGTEQSTVCDGGCRTRARRLRLVNKLCQSWRGVIATTVHVGLEPQGTALYNQSFQLGTAVQAAGDIHAAIEALGTARQFAAQDTYSLPALLAGASPDAGDQWSGPCGCRSSILRAVAPSRGTMHVIMHHACPPLSCASCAADADVELRRTPGIDLRVGQGLASWTWRCSHRESTAKWRR
jgi:hypothetical protein